MRSRLSQAWGVVGILIATLGTAKAQVATNNHVLSYAITTNATGNRSLVCQLSPTGAVEVTPFAADVVRVRFHFAGLYDREEPALAKAFSNWPAFSCTFTQATATNLLIQTDQLQVEVVLSNRFRVHFKDPSGYDLSRDLHMEYNLGYHQNLDTGGYAQVSWPGESTSISNLPSGFKLKAIRYMATNEAFFGAGERATALNARGQTVQYWNQDTYSWGEQRNPMYMSLPFFYGALPATTGHPAFAYGLLFNNPARPVFKFTSGLGDTYSMEAGDDQIDYFFFGGGPNHSPRRILDRYSELTGRPTMLPKWALGFHQSRHSYFTQETVHAVANAFRTNDMPCDAIYLDIGTQSGNPPNQLTFNSSYTNVPGLVSYCSNLGIRLVPLVEPLLTTNDPLYGEAFSNLYFLKNNDLSTHVGTNFLGTNSWLDFSISFARDWWTAKLTNYLASGFEALWNDLNEPNDNSLNLDVLYFLDGRYGGGLVTNDTRKWHAVNKNTYSLLQAGVSYRALQTRQPDRRPFVLSRSAWPGIARYAVGWSGDNVASFEHLRHNIRLGGNVMISGQPWFGHDIGGFLGSPGSELFTRWLEWGVFTPLCRNHADLFADSREPWLFPSPYKEWNRRWMKFRYELMPYLYTLAYQTSTGGVPMNTPVLFDYTSDTNTWTQNEYDFLVGRDLLVAPVYVSNATARSAYLPAGRTWYSWWTDQAYAGGQTVTVPASLGSVPLFLGAGAIVPMGPAMAYANEFVPDYLDLHLWPGASNEFTLYEDDGLTTNYLAGGGAFTRFTQATSTSSWSLAADARSGSFDPGARAFFAVWHQVTNVAAVLLNGQPLSRWANRDELETYAATGWAFNLPAHQLVVRVPDSGSAFTLTAQQELRIDSDGDGMPDAWEQAHFGLLTNAAAGNPDGDARNNLAEYQAGGDPLVSDVFTAVGGFTNMAVAGSFSFWNESARNMRLVSNSLWAAVVDLSGLTNIEYKFVADDAWSLANWGDTNQLGFVVPINQTAELNVTNNILANGVFTGRYTFTFNNDTRAYSLYPAGAVDSDGDGLSDEWEFYYGLNPLARADAADDADGDGLANSNEFAQGSSPVRADTDGDRQSDLDEFVAGTSLTNAAAFFALAAESLASTGVVVSWTAVTGRYYDIHYVTGLSDTSAWSVLVPLTNLSGTGAVAVTDTNPAAERHYRIQVRRQ